MLHRIHIHELVDNFLTVFFPLFHLFLTFFFSWLLLTRNQNQLIKNCSCRNSGFFSSRPVFLQVLKGTQLLPTNVITHVLIKVQSSFNHETEELDFKKRSLCVTQVLKFLSL